MEKHKTFKYLEQEAFEKCWAYSPLRAAARPNFTLPFTRYRYCRTPPACVSMYTTRQRQRVTEGTAMAPWNGPKKHSREQCSRILAYCHFRSIHAIHVPHVPGELSLPGCRRWMAMMMTTLLIVEAQQEDDWTIVTSSCSTKAEFTLPTRNGRVGSCRQCKLSRQQSATVSDFK